MLTRTDLSTVWLNYWHLSSFVSSHISFQLGLYFPRMSDFWKEPIYDTHKANTGVQWSGFPWVITSVSSGSIYDPESLTRHGSYQGSACTIWMSDCYCQLLNALRKGEYDGFLEAPAREAMCWWKTSKEVGVSLIHTCRTASLEQHSTTGLCMIAFWALVGFLYTGFQGQNENSYS